MEQLKKELGDNVECFVANLSKPEEIAEAVFFTASEKASYMTGAVINVNGGSVI